MLKVEAAHIVHPVLRAPSSEAKQLYSSLLDNVPDEAALARSRFYLAEQLRAAEQFDAHLPRDLGALSSWIESNARQVGDQYREYLEARKAGDARRYFTSKSHALFFLKSVALTKLVDGAWLYGLVDRWRDARFSALIRIYLEELGEGIPDKNHVVIFKKLLATHGCNQWDKLSNAHFVQGSNPAVACLSCSRFFA